MNSPAAAGWSLSRPELLYKVEGRQRGRAALPRGSLPLYPLEKTQIRLRLLAAMQPFCSLWLRRRRSAEAAKLFRSRSRVAAKLETGSRVAAKLETGSRVAAKLETGSRRPQVCRAALPHAESAGVPRYNVQALPHAESAAVPSYNMQALPHAEFAGVISRTAACTAKRHCSQTWYIRARIYGRRLWHTRSIGEQVLQYRRRDVRQCTSTGIGSIDSSIP